MIWQIFTSNFNRIIDDKKKMFFLELDHGEIKKLMKILF